MKNEEKALKTTYIGIFGNTALALIKWVTGYFGNSYALIADAIESTTDIFSSVLLLFGIKYSLKPPDADHPYGHGRAEPLTTFLVVGFLIVSAGVIARQSIINICTPHELPKPYTLVVLAIVIVAKEIFYRVIIKRSEETKSSSLKADAWHHRSDVLTSVAVFIGISTALILGPGYEAADDWAALFASGLIVYNSYVIFRPALGEIMDERLYDNVASQVRMVAQKVEGVIDTEKCNVRKVGFKYYIDLHITVDGDLSVREGHQIAHHLKDCLMTDMPEIGDVLIHVEPMMPVVRN